MFFDFYLEKNKFENDTSLQKKYNTFENLVEFSDNIEIFVNFKYYKFVKYISENHSEEDFIDILVEHMSAFNSMPSNLFKIDSDKLIKRLKEKLDECPY